MKMITVFTRHAILNAAVINGPVAKTINGS